MESPFLKKADKWITKILSYPGIDKNTLAQEKMYWISSVAVTTMIFCLTIVCHIVFPQLRIIIYYGLFLTATYLQGVIFPPFIHRAKVTWQLTRQDLKMYHTSAGFLHRSLSSSRVRYINRVFLS